MPLQNEGIFSGYLRKKRQTISSKYCKGSVLDFGSGDGSFSEYFEYDKYIGYEPDHDSISDAKKTYSNKKFISSIEELKAGNFLRAVTKAFVINASGVIFNFSPV